MVENDGKYKCRNWEEEWGKGRSGWIGKVGEDGKHRKQSGKRRKKKRKKPEKQLIVDGFKITKLG